MDIARYQKAYATLPRHFFLHVERKLGYGRYILIDRLTGRTCRVEGASEAFQVGQEIEVQKGVVGVGGLAKLALRSIFGMKNPFKNFRIMDLSSQNVSQVELEPHGDVLEFAEVCWNERKKFDVYRQ
jgi:hypothetical protein